MKKKTQTINAKPLYLLALDTQINEAGGQGFNCDVRQERLENSFSCHYYFGTSTGEKCLITLNEFVVGSINDSERNYVIFNADNGEYTLATPSSNASKSLGFSFESMFEAVSLIWPKRIVWDLSDPSQFINA